MTDPAVGTDVAVLSLASAVAVEPFILDDKDRQPLGQTVWVVEPSRFRPATIGVTALTVQVANGGRLIDAFELDSRASPGSSGAPVIRADSGLVVGMVVAGAKETTICVSAGRILRALAESRALADSSARQASVPPGIDALAPARQEPARAPGSPSASSAATESVPGYAADTTDGQDNLNIRPSVYALSALLAARSLTPPVSIGLFGDWGTGKSFFMRQMRMRIRQLAQEARAAQDEAPDQSPAAVSSYCSAVRQVTFNAWHYADTNLWASLAANIFDSLASGHHTEVEDEADPVKLEQSSLRDTLQEREVQRRLLAGTLAGVEAEEDRLASARVSSLLPVLRDAVLSQDLDALSEALGTTDPSVAEIRAAASRLGTAGRESREIWTEIRHGRLRSWVPIAAALGVALVVAALVLVFTRVWPRPLAALVPGALTLLAAVGAAAERVIRVSRAARRLVQGVERAQEAALRPLADKREKLRRELAAVDEEIKQLNARAEDLEPARRLERFLAERGASPDYRQHLGVVAVARRDFEILAELLASGRSSSVTGQIERIVLYIDDLDRCPPEIVVKVLEAVHLLLALPLFVVVVAVDPRWLLRAVQRHYRTMLAPPGAEAPPGRRMATALDYLEKIFQIPFALPLMRSDGFARLITAAMRPTNEGRRPGGTSAATTSPPGDAVVGEAANGAGVASSDAAGLPVPTVLASQEQIELRPRALAVEDSELDLLGRLGGLIPTPRAAKRLANIYQLIRLQVPPEELDEFVGTPKRPGRCAATMLLTAVVVGFPEDAAEFLRRVSRSAAGETLVSLVDSQDDGALNRLRTALTLLVKTDGPFPSFVEAYQAEISRVSGFSFRTAVVLEPTSKRWGSS